MSPVFGDRLVSVTYSKLDGKHLLASWIPLLALFAHDPDRDWSAVCIGRAEAGTTPRVRGAGPARQGRRRAAARSGGDLRRRAPRAASAAAQDVLRLGGRAARGRRPGARGADTGGSPATIPGEDEDPAHVRAWGQNARLDDLMQPLRPGEEDDGEDQPARRLRRPAVAADAARGREALTLMEPFRPAGPAAAGGSTTVLEASAGTGKTFALAGLVTRYVAEGAATLDQMLLITFSRAASQELRERVRRQIVEAAAAFDDPSARRRQRAGRLPADGHRRAARGRAGSGCATRWPASTPRRSPPPTSSASWC